jgi:hypothetical protein
VRAAASPDHAILTADSAQTEESTALDRTERYGALLRGINAGSANLIPMAALRASFRALGLLDVTSFIASGSNVLFRSTPTDSRIRVSRIERRRSPEGAPGHAGDGRDLRLMPR